MQILFSAQAVVLNRVWKLAPVSTWFNSAISWTLQACLKRDANLQDFTEKVQQNHAEFAAGLDVRVEVGALRKKIAGKYDPKIHQKSHV